MAATAPKRIPENGVYRILCIPENRAYVGESIDLDRRWAEHRCALRKGTHGCRPLQEAWRRHGESSFEFQILAITKSSRERHEEETFHWRNEMTPYNQAPGYQRRRKPPRSAAKAAPVQNRTQAASARERTPDTSSPTAHSSQLPLPAPVDADLVALVRPPVL